MTPPNRYFGAPAQQALERRAERLWKLVGGDPRYVCHGRVVGLLAGGIEALDLQIALARLQGVGPSGAMSPDAAPTCAAALEAEGLVVDRFARWRSGEGTLAAARAAMAARALPEGFELRHVDADTTEAEWDRLDALTGACGVLMPAAAFLRGEAGPAVCLYAAAPDGEIAGVAASVVEAPGPGSAAWWGMLSTAEAWRGRGIAALLGAAALVEMRARGHAGEFWTGIRAGNVESERLCAGLGFADSGRVDLIAVDPEAMSGGRLTK